MLRRKRERERALDACVTHSQKVKMERMSAEMRALEWARERKTAVNLERERGELRRRERVENESERERE